MTIDLPDEKLQAIIEAHRKIFGQAPKTVVIPLSEIKPITYLGVRIELQQYEGYFTIDKDHCFHHKFTNNDGTWEAK